MTFISVSIKLITHMMETLKMNENAHTEVLADGTISHIDFDVCNDAAAEVLDLLWNKQDKILSYDYTTTVFSLFVNSINILSNAGWSTQELLQEVLNHSDAEDSGLGFQDE